MANRPWDERRRVLMVLMKSYREQKSITQIELASRLDKPQSYISKFESGERRLDFVEVLEICEVIGVAPAQLIADYQDAL